MSRSVETQRDGIAIRGVMQGARSGAFALTTSHLALRLIGLRQQRDHGQRTE